MHANEIMQRDMTINSSKSEIAWLRSRLLDAEREIERLRQALRHKSTDDHPSETCISSPRHALANVIYSPATLKPSRPLVEVQGLEHRIAINDVKGADVSLVPRPSFEDEIFDAISYLLHTEE
jgi:hypothetical protein